MSNQQEYMYLKNPDWDMDLPRIQVTSTGITESEARAVSKLRQDAQRDMWGNVIDGEYLFITKDGTLHRDGVQVDRAADLPDGVYRLSFRGGYVDDDWCEWSAKYARRVPCAEIREEIEVLLRADVVNGIATFSIDPPESAA